MLIPMWIVVRLTNNQQSAFHWRLFRGEAESDRSLNTLTLSIAGSDLRTPREEKVASATIKLATINSQLAASKEIPPAEIQGRTEPMSAAPTP